jgi:hypothetical protein
MSGALTFEEMQLLQRIAIARFGETTKMAGEAELKKVTQRIEDAGEAPLARAAAACAGMFEVHGPAGAATALLATCCQLRLDGRTLVAPQGVISGMVSGVAAGTVGVSALAAWLEDRAAVGSAG